MAYKSGCPDPHYLSDLVLMTLGFFVFLEHASLFPTSGPLVCLLCLDTLPQELPVADYLSSFKSKLKGHLSCPDHQSK